MKKKILSIGLLTALSCSSTFAEIEFYGDDNALGRAEGVLLDTEKKNINLKDNNSWNNDKIRSLKLKSVSPNTIIRLFDSPTASQSDDWVEIKVKKEARTLIIPQLERNDDNEYYTQKTYYKNGLNGKVSHVEVIKPDESKFTLNAKIMSNLMSCPNYWKLNDKNYSAFKFSTNNRNYRIWKPDITISNQQSIQTSFKLDHIRGGQLDQHMNIYMTFDNKGFIESLRLLTSSQEDSKEINVNNKSQFTSISDCPNTTPALKAQCALGKLKSYKDHGAVIYERGLQLSNAIEKALISNS